MHAVKKSTTTPRLETETGAQKEHPLKRSRENLTEVIPAVPPEPIIDFEVQNHGSIFLLCPLTDSAIEWVDEHLPEDVLTFGRGICVEHRFISDIVRGIQDSGLVAR